MCDAVRVKSAASEGALSMTPPPHNPITNKGVPLHHQGNALCVVPIHLSVSAAMSLSSAWTNCPMCSPSMKRWFTSRDRPSFSRPFCST